MNVHFLLVALNPIAEVFKERVNRIYKFSATNRLYITLSASVTSRTLYLL